MEVPKETLEGFIAKVIGKSHKSNREETGFVMVLMAYSTQDYVMNINKFLFLLTFILIFNTFIFSQEEGITPTIPVTEDQQTPLTVPPPQKHPPISVFELYPQAIGYSLGEMTGSGFTYRQWQGDWGWQLSGLVVFDPNDTNFLSNDYLYHSTGVAVLRTLFKGEPTEWFYTQLYVLGHGSFVGNKTYYWDETTGYVKTIGPYASSGNLGLGLGVEVGLFKHLSAVVEVSERARLTVPLGTKIFDLGAVVQGSLLYRF